MSDHCFQAKSMLIGLAFAFVSTFANANSPEVPTLPIALQRTGHFTLASRAIEASGTAGKVLSDGKSSLTFFAPTDDSCASESRLRQRVVNADWAKTFVLSHTFHGQVNLITTADGPRVSLVSEQGGVTSVAEGGSLEIVNYLGKKKLLSVKNGLVHLDDSVPVETKGFFVTSSGSVGTINSCHEFE